MASNLVITEKLSSFGNYDRNESDEDAIGAAEATTVFHQNHFIS